MRVQDIYSFKQKALQLASTFSVAAYYDSNDYHDPYGAYDVMIAIGDDAQLSVKSELAFDKLKSFYEQHQTWIFGLLGYDLKNEIENLDSQKTDHLLFPDLFFFVPRHLILIQGNEVTIPIGGEGIITRINEMEVNNEPACELNIKKRVSRDAYIYIVNELQQRILRGDIYEVNLCQEFFAEHANIDPPTVYRKLNQISPTPFSGFFKINDQFILSASPERFLCKQGDKLISQPIKGTAKRSDDPSEDAALKLNLQQNAKEQAENVMIVDLVRNDLTKSAVKGSVRVEELFGIYGFPQVYQMISTISCQIAPHLHCIDAIKNTFPMGSMTGAPKIKAMELIELYESSRRGAYSGAFGYIDPKGNFDFNVIIRSIFYSAAAKYLSFQVGGAITYASDAADEYEECLVKASAIIQTLTN